MTCRPNRRTVLRWLAGALIAPSSLRLPCLAQGASADGPVRLATFNIHHGEGADGRLDLDRVAEVVREAEVVAFQEVDVRFRARSQFADQAEELARRLGGRSAFGGNLVEGEGRYGVALVTRLPIVAQRNHRLPHSPGRDKAEPRGALEVRVALGSREVRFFVTHLAHDSVADRKLQVEHLRTLVAAEAGPAVVMGDLNLRPESPEYAQLFRVGDDGRPLLVDAWPKAGQGDGATIGLGGKSPGRIDYILATPDLAPGLADARVDVQTRASDHQPLFATLRLPGR